MEKKVFTMTVMAPTVINEDNTLPKEELICRSDNQERYKDCDDYNNQFCRECCEFGTKEVSVKIIAERGALTDVDLREIDAAREEKSAGGMIKQICDVCGVEFYGTVVSGICPSCYV